MRAVNLKKSAGELYKASSPRLKRFFEVYARGVNAYLFRYRDKLPADLASSGYKPEYWQPEDSALIFCLLNFSQSANLPEEISALVLAQTVSTDKLPWLTPSAPDEQLPAAESEKLQGIKLNGQVPGLAEISKATSQLAELNLLAPLHRTTGPLPRNAAAAARACWPATAMGRWACHRCSATCRFAHRNTRHPA